MTMALLICSFLLLATIVMGIVRFINGPDTLNRIIAFDLVCISIIALICIYSIMDETFHLIEILLAFCLLGFTSTLAFIDSFFKIEETTDG
ncbi:MAG: hypothetical protein H7A37_10500 [Chlamydiales bacterium]|nr:hypothetical protein [Chlamydiia bacterium]MCP5508707.1 hypothetical protein [Chlamydiales bacterium]